MKVEKIYDMYFDNPFKEDGSKKDSTLLGEFEIIEIMNEDSYSSQRIGVLHGTDRVYLINEREVSGIGGGSRFEIKYLQKLTVR